MSTDADLPNSSAAPSTSSTPTTSVNTAALPDDPAVLKRMIAELLRELRKERRDKESAERRLDALLRRYYERQANPDQPLLFPDANEAPAADESPVAAVPEKMTSRRGKCQPHGRRRPARNLRREQRRYELTHAERLCPECGGERQEIGAETTAQ